MYPRGETLERLLRPVETQAFAGNQVARSRGEGIEFADLRPFTPGDRVRRVNWRATARRGVPWVNEAHPERNSDVVIFLDTFAEVRRADTGTLDLGVRAAAALAALYLQEKDRVGLVCRRRPELADGVRRETQLYRIVDSLLDAEIALSYAWKDLDVLPARTLPPRALVIALSPLLDERAVGALLDLRARGFDLAVLELSPSRSWRRGRARRSSSPTACGASVVRDCVPGTRRVGWRIAEWSEGVPMEAVMEEVRGFNRHARVVRA